MGYQWVFVGFLIGVGLIVYGIIKDPSFIRPNVQTKKIIYRYLPRSMQDEMINPESPLHTFADMFAYSDPQQEQRGFALSPKSFVTDDKKNK